MRFLTIDGLSLSTNDTTDGYFPPHLVDKVRDTIREARRHDRED